MNKEIEKDKEKDKDIPYTKKDREILNSILSRYPDSMKELEGKSND